MSNSYMYKAYREQCNNSNSQWLNFAKNLLFDLGFSHTYGKIIVLLILLHYHYVFKKNKGKVTILGTGNEI